MVGGGAVGLIILIAALLLGVDPTGLIDTTSQPPIEGAQSQTLQECRTGADANKRADCRVVGFVDSVQKYWDDEFNRRAATYSPATTVIFTSYVEAACGTASGAMGPFYCPTDQKVYLDLSFFDDLETQFGAKGGPFAVGYVIAHEYGHHVQDELGLLNTGSSNRASVRTELIRSNIVALAYNGIRLTSATRKFLFGKPVEDGTGAALTRQQVTWLTGKGPTGEVAAPSGSAP